jgi:hypothetical protein
MISSVFIVLYDASYFVWAYSSIKSSFPHGFLHNRSKNQKSACFNQCPLLKNSMEQRAFPYIGLNFQYDFRALALL